MIKVEEMIYMIKQLAWNTFKETGDITAYLEFKEVKNIEEKMKVILDETSKSQWCSNCRKQYG